MTHVDDTFLRKVTQLYRQRIPEGAAVMDLMSSWVSHLPPEQRYSKVIGHGMNAAEVCGPSPPAHQKNLVENRDNTTMDHQCNTS